MGISVLSPSSYGPTQNLLHNGAMQVAQRGYIGYGDHVPHRLLRWDLAQYRWVLHG
jgi:hypothetical protein